MRGRDHTTASMKPGNQQKRKWKPTEWNVRDPTIPWPLFLDSSSGEKHSSMQDVIILVYRVVNTCLPSTCLILKHQQWQRPLFCAREVSKNLFSTDISSAVLRAVLHVCVDTNSHKYTQSQLCHDLVKADWKERSNNIEQKLLGIMFIATEAPYL